jgi:hypothetical protein
MSSSDEQLLQRLQNQALEDRQEPERRDSIDSIDSDVVSDEFDSEQKSTCGWIGTDEKGMLRMKMRVNKRLFNILFVPRGDRQVQRACWPTMRTTSNSSQRHRKHEFELITNV